MRIKAGQNTVKNYNFIIRHFLKLNPIPPRLFSNLFPLGGGRHVPQPVKLHTKIFLHQNFGFEGPGFDSL